MLELELFTEHIKQSRACSTFSCSILFRACTNLSPCWPNPIYYYHYPLAFLCIVTISHECFQSCTVLLGCFSAGLSDLGAACAGLELLPGLSATFMSMMAALTASITACIIS